MVAGVMAEATTTAVVEQITGNSASDSLKALLESNEDSTACAIRKIVICPPPPLVPSQNVLAHVDSYSGSSAKETVLGEEEGPLKTSPVVEMSCQGGDKDKKTLSPSVSMHSLTGASMHYLCIGTQIPFDVCILSGCIAALMAFDDHLFQSASAHAIMHLAASTIDFTQDNLCNGNAALRSFLGHAREAGEKNYLVASTTLNSHTMQTGKMIEYQQQFREKVNISRDSDEMKSLEEKGRNQTEKGKRGEKGTGKHTGQTSSSFEMYLNQQIGTHYSIGQSRRSGANSPPKSTVSHAFCSSADIQAKLVNLSVDLNDGMICRIRESVTVKEKLAPLNRPFGYCVWSKVWHLMLKGLAFDAQRFDGVACMLLYWKCSPTPSFHSHIWIVRCLIKEFV
ncbi:Detected protein of confused Function [Hibiscus syriacus]|uniref:Detected protein of confused Function n=1 Tax=Hibiscus syriacus TaxID=106335 RepID=A0A6A2XEH1_HIBSY|nr:Detected protein of confused Function [Hibiscus syriacus]